MRIRVVFSIFYTEDLFWNLFEVLVRRHFAAALFFQFLPSVACNAAAFFCSTPILRKTLRVGIPRKGGWQIAPPFEESAQLLVAPSHIFQVARRVHGIGQSLNHVGYYKPPCFFVPYAANLFLLE